MTRADARRHLVLALADLAHVAERLHVFDVVVRQAEGGLTAQAFTERVSGGGGVASPVERIAGARDPARDARKRVDRDLAEVAAIAKVLRDRVDSWIEPARREGARGGDRGCSVCRSVGSHEPATLTDVDGNLAEKTLLCRRHRDFVKRTGRLPTRKERSAQAMGRRPRVA